MAALLFALLLALTLGAFATARALRSQDDIVNAVRIAGGPLREGEQARISFRLAEPDGRADVLMVDREGRPARALALGAELARGRHVFVWDGSGDDGERVPPGRYRLRVLLAEQDREIDPPGSIRVLGGSGAGGS